MLSAMTDALMRRLGRAEPKCQSTETDKGIAVFRYPEPGNAGRFANLHAPELLGAALEPKRRAADFTARPGTYRHRREISRSRRRSFPSTCASDFRITAHGLHGSGWPEPLY